MIKENIKPKVSVIVPVYNTSKYLERCFESIMNQTLKEIEIIAINDGSTDNSLKVLRKYEIKDKRIKVINKNNEGLSATRNIGIEYSNGEYITFVDSDDWIDNTMLEEMYTLSDENNCDLVICSYRKEYEQKGVDRLLDYEEKEFFEKDRFEEKVFRRLVGPVGKEMADPSHIDSLNTAWGKLYKGLILKSKNIKFIDTKLIGTEDCLFNIMAFNCINSAVIINKPFYHYWKGNTTSLTSVYKEDLSLKWDRLHNRISKILDNNNKELIFYEALNNRICMSTLGLILNECSNKDVSVLKRIEGVKAVLNNKNIIGSFSDFNLEYLPMYWKFFYYFNKKRNYILSYFMGSVINSLRKLV